MARIQWISLCKVFEINLYKFPEHFTYLFKNIIIPKKLQIKYSYILQKTRQNYPSIK